MKYYSTSRKSPSVSFREAAIRGLAPDGGLYFPEQIPLIDASLLEDIENLPKEEIAYRVIRPYIGDDIPEAKLRSIVKESIDFPIPLVPVTDRISSLELFHGPTLAFKDVGARFMSRCLGHFLQGEQRKVTVLVATSGDTGGAVASGFFNVAGVEVVILYPSGKVSPVQEKQLTALGNNIHALEVNGTFDDCQRMVKQAFSDSDLENDLFLTSANSINVARWLPQQFYYFLAYQSWTSKNDPPVISVPSGNFGNICAGILAMHSGLPIGHFIAACNANDIVSEYLETGQLKPKEAVPTISNAMDVGNPSNFIRILEIFHQDFPALKEKLSSATITDVETIDTISRLWKEHQYLADPHGAVGYLALERYLQDNENHRGIFLETAHPVKFPEPVQQATGLPVELPSAVATLMKAIKKSILIEPSYQDFKDYLVGNR